jgi:predicted RNA binding protein YcfA (HicA-like mRNA interferase family)
MKLPRDLSGSDVVKALGRMGFVVMRQEGSHIRLEKGSFGVTVPNHRTLVPKTLQSIMRQAGVTIEHLRDNL